MATIYASTDDALVYKTAGVSPYWDAVHDATTGAAINHTTSFNTAAVAVNCLAGGRGTIWLASRVLMDFDTSGISVAPSAATLKVYGITNNTADIIVLRSFQDLDDIATDWYNAMIDPTTTIIGNAWGTGDVTEYSNQIATWSTTGYNDIALNSDALSDIVSGSTFNCVLIGYVYDYLDQDLSSAYYRAGFRQDAYTGTSSDPYIDYTLAAVAADNAIFFGTNF